MSHVDIDDGPWRVAKELRQQGDVVGLVVGIEILTPGDIDDGVTPLCRDHPLVERRVGVPIAAKRLDQSLHHCLRPSRLAGVTTTIFLISDLPTASSSARGCARP